VAERACLLDVTVGDLRCVVLRRPSGSREDIVRPSPRERQIAALVARGYPNKWIASALGISAWTVATHLRRTFGKLGVSNRAEMVALLSSAGLLGESLSSIGPGLG
jgi:DNA-binding CsgD family transcriptional regulator